MDTNMCKRFSLPHIIICVSWECTIGIFHYTNGQLNSFSAYPNQSAHSNPNHCGVSNSLPSYHFFKFPTHKLTKFEFKKN